MKHIDYVNPIVVAATACGIAMANANVVLAQDGNSGFLGDYERLEKSEDKFGPFRSWVSPKLTPKNYHALIVDPIVYYPEPRPSEKVSSETLEEIVGYSNEVLKRSLAKRIEIVDRPGPGVAHLRVAFTSVVAGKEGLAPHQYVPIAFLATMASRAARGTPKRARIVVEAEVRDSLTGKLLGLKTRAATGERLARVAAEQVITLEAVKPILDELAEHAFEQAHNYIKPK